MIHYPRLNPRGGKSVQIPNAYKFSNIANANANSMRPFNTMSSPSLGLYQPFQGAPDNRSFKTFSPIAIAIIVTLKDVLIHVPDDDIDIFVTEKNITSDSPLLMNQSVIITNEQLVEFDAFDNEVVILDIIQQTAVDYSAKVTAFNHAILPRSIVTTEPLPNDINFDLSEVTYILSATNPNGIYFYFDMSMLFSLGDPVLMDTATIVYEEDTLFPFLNKDTEVLVTRKDISSASSTLSDGIISITNQDINFNANDNEVIVLDVSKMIDAPGYKSRSTQFNHEIFPRSIISTANLRDDSIPTATLHDKSISTTDLSNVTMLLSAYLPNTPLFYFDLDALLCMSIPSSMDNATILMAEDQISSSLNGNVEFFVTRKDINYASPELTNGLVQVAQQTLEFNAHDNEVVILDLSKASDNSNFYEKVTQFNHATLPRNIYESSTYDSTYDISEASNILQQYLSPSKIFFFFDLDTLLTVNPYSPMDYATVVNTEDAFTILDNGVEIFNTRKDVSIRNVKDPLQIGGFDTLDNQVVILDVTKTSEGIDFSEKVTKFNHAILPRSVDKTTIYDTTYDISGTSDVLHNYYSQSTVLYYFDLDTLLSVSAYSPVDNATIISGEDTLIQYRGMDLFITEQNTYPIKQSQHPSSKMSHTVLEDYNYNYPPYANRVEPDGRSMVILDIEDSASSSSGFSETLTKYSNAATTSDLFTDTDNMSGISDILAAYDPSEILFFFDLDQLMSDT